MASLASASSRMSTSFLPSSRTSFFSVSANHILSIRQLSSISHHNNQTHRLIPSTPFKSFSIPNNAQSRSYAKKSRFSPAQIYHNLIKQSMAQGSWEVNEYENQGSSKQPYMQTARLLKENLAAAPGSDTLDFSAIKSLLIQLLTELPAYDPHGGTPNTRSPVFAEKKIISNACSVLLSSNTSNNSFSSNLSFDDAYTIYRLMVEKTGNIFSKDGAVPVIPNLFSLLNKYATEESKTNSSFAFAENILPIHLLYFKYLSNVSKIRDSDGYLKWLLTIHHPEQDQKLFDMFLHAISLPEIERTAVPALFRHVIRANKTKQIGSGPNATNNTLFTPFNASFEFAFKQMANYHKTFLLLVPTILQAYPQLYSDANVVSTIFDALNNNIRTVEKSQAFLKQFYKYHNNNDQPLTELDNVLQFEDQDKKLAFHRQLAIAFIKYGPELISSVQSDSQRLKTDIDAYLNEYLPNTFSQDSIRDIGLYKSLKLVDASSTADQVISIFQTAIDDGEGSGLEVSHIIVNNAFDILSSRGFNLAENFDDIHDYFERQLNFESSIDTFDCLIIGALNNNYVAQPSTHEQSQRKTETENDGNAECNEPKSAERVAAEKALLFFEKSILAGTAWSQATKDQFATLDSMIVQLAQTMPNDVFKVFKAYQRVKQFRKQVGYPAQAQLLKLFLSYNYVGDVERFLADELGEEDRRNVSWDSEPELYQTLFEYACRSTNYKDAWLIYGLSEKYFESPYSNYFTIMKHFCDLGRPDAALLIFKNVRNRSRSQGSRPPNEQMYALLFHEFGLSGYELGVNELHTMYKVDIDVEPSVGLLNSIMEAYTALDDPGNAIEMWTQIENFPGGPDNQSYTNVLKLCTKASIHDVENMWQKLVTDKNVKLNEENVRQYLIANCYHGFYSRALEIAKDVSQGTLPELDYSSTQLLTSSSSPSSSTTSSNIPAPKYHFSESTLAALYNWTLTKARKEEVASWAQQTFPDTWEKAQSSGALQMFLVDEENKHNDSDVNLRKQVHEEMKQEGTSVDGEMAKNLLPARND